MAMFATEQTLPPPALTLFMGIGPTHWNPPALAAGSEVVP